MSPALVSATTKIEVPEKHWDAMFAPSSCLTMITSVNESGEVNAATYGTCTRVAHNPVHLLFAVTADPPSDTYMNVLETGQFVVNAVAFDDELLARCLVVGLPFEPGVNELQRAGLTELPSLTVAPPRIAECHSHFECEVAWVQTFEHRAIICGKVVAVTIDEDCYDPRGVVYFDKLKPAHYAGAPYGSTFVAAYEPHYIERRYDGPADWRDGTPTQQGALPDIIGNTTLSVEFGGPEGVGH
ncbi:flavin reductase family protein [Subtercola lobariae]|uniref:Flavin reductase like domain-containing protein n=1 Tax=Subtercola lobariae TaxID=1588641 RepID=A0A917B8M9_9MICO|nr:flavin reductase family protein [Subtercola lobariae]GGF30613.1 hypothetical protein GCM10011399_24830 [Subtercola lobariae]